MRTSKDVIFDKDDNHNYTDEYPSDLNFSNLHQNINNDISAVLPANKVVGKDSEQRLATPAIPIHPVPVIPCII